MYTRTSQCQSEFSGQGGFRVDSNGKAGAATFLPDAAVRNPTDAELWTLAE